MQEDNLQIVTWMPHFFERFLLKCQRTAGGDSIGKCIVFGASKVDAIRLSTPPVTHRCKSEPWPYGAAQIDVKKSRKNLEIANEIEIGEHRQFSYHVAYLKQSFPMVIKTLQPIAKVYLRQLTTIL